MYVPSAAITSVPYLPTNVPAVVKLKPVSLLFKSATPWAPEFFAVFLTIYTRANMIASGKMFLANSMPTSKLAWFWWNPLFHVIDQTRGFVFLNYNPHYSNIAYPIEVTLVLILLGNLVMFAKPGFFRVGRTTPLPKSS